MGSDTQKPEVVPIAVKEAEMKLKEMSRKAKERKTASAPRKPSTPKGWSNLNLFLAGGMGAGIFGILYLIFRKPKEEWVFTPHEQSPEKPVRKEESKPPEQKKTKPDFELNSF